VGNLEENLPKLAKEALKGEDKVTRGLVTLLLQQVYAGQRKSNLRQVVQVALDTEIDKYLSTGFVDIDDLEAN